MADQALSYNDVSVRESLASDIKIITPIDTYVTSNAGSIPGGVKQKIHSWIVDQITKASSQVGATEGATYTFSNTDPTLLTNYTQIISQGFKVTGTDEASDSAGFKSRYAHEQMKAMKLFKSQLEYSVINGAVDAGSSTTPARKMKGIRNFAVSNATTTTAGAGVLTAKLFSGILKSSSANGGVVDTILVGFDLKEEIDVFTANNTRNVAAKDAELVGRVDVYDSSSGRVKIVRHIQVAAGEIIGYIGDMIHVDYLRAPKVKDVPATGDYAAGVVIGEATAQIDNELAVLRSTGWDS